VIVNLQPVCRGDFQRAWIFDDDDGEKDRERKREGRQHLQQEPATRSEHAFHLGLHEIDRTSVQVEGIVSFHRLYFTKSGQRVVFGARLNKRLSFLAERSNTWE
jgi:hypothetical protein